VLSLSLKERALLEEVRILRFLLLLIKGGGESIRGNGVG